MPAELSDRPKGPHGISWQLAEQIRATIRRLERPSMAQIAADAGVALETVERIAHNMRKQAKRQQKAQACKGISRDE